MKICVAWFAATMFSVAMVRAHDPGLSGLLLRVNGSELRATLTLARADAEAIAVIDLDRNGQVSTNEFERSRPWLERELGEALIVQLDGVRVKPRGASVRWEPSGEVVFAQTFSLPAGSRLQVSSALMARLPRGHRQYVLMRDATGKPLGDRMLDATNPVFDAELPGSR